MKKIRIGLFISMMVLLFSCSGKKQDSVPAATSKTPAIQTEIKEDNKEIPAVTAEKTEEKTRKEIKNPLIFYKQCDFSPIENIDVKSVVIENTENNCISLIYKGETLFSISDLEFEITNLTNYCEPYLNDRLFSSFFIIYAEKKQYYSVISFNKGLIKIYTCEENISPLFYSGTSDYFIFEDNWISKPSYYDYKTFKTVPPEFDAELYLINIDSDEMAYSIESRLLHENVKLSIDKINYEDDGFRVIIGNCMDSDEFVDFKLYTANNDFHYEIFDKYTYER